MTLMTNLEIYLVNEKLPLKHFLRRVRIHFQEADILLWPI
jgi:hypothetical protein